MTLLQKLDEYENALPELVTHVEFLKKYTAWMISVQSDDERLGLEFIVGELLKITLKRDFCDETGRREALNFLRNAFD